MTAAMSALHKDGSATDGSRVLEAASVESTAKNYAPNGSARNVVGVLSVCKQSQQRPSHSSRVAQVLLAG